MVFAFRFFVSFILCSSVSLGTTIENEGDFRGLATKEGYLAGLSLLRSKEQSAEWIQKGYDSGKFESSIAEYIPQKLSDAVAGRGLFSEVKSDVVITFRDPTKGVFSNANWNALLIVNYIAAAYYDVFSLKNELGRRLFSCEGIDRVCDRLQKDYAGFASQIDAAKRDIKIYAEHLRLYDSLEQMVAIKSEARGTADGILLAPGVMGKFDRNSKSGNFDVFASVGGKGGKKEILRRVVDRGADKGYLQNTEKDVWKCISLDADMVQQSGDPSPLEYKFDNKELEATFERVNASTDVLEALGGDRYKPYLQALGLWEYYGNTEKTELARVEIPATQEPPKAPIKAPTPMPINDGLVVNGLLNLGRTCYFNATMQGLRSSPSFRGLIESLAEKENGEDWTVARFAKNIFDSITNNNGYNLTVFENLVKALRANSEKSNIANSFDLRKIFISANGGSIPQETSLSDITCEELNMDLQKLKTVVADRLSAMERLKNSFRLNGEDLTDLEKQISSAKKVLNVKDNFNQLAKVMLPPKDDQDAGELLRLLIEALKFEAKKLGQMDEFGNLLDLSGATLKVCDAGHRSVRDNSENDSSFLLSVFDEFGNIIGSLKDGFDNYLKEEKIEDFFCEQCGKKVNITKKNIFKKLPKMLSVIFGRYQNNGTPDGTKIGDKIDYPVEISLPEFERENIEYKQYKLTGVVLQSGSTGGGHYVSNVLGNKSQWWRVDDSKAALLGDGSFKAEQDAYVLFYEQTA